MFLSTLGEAVPEGNEASLRELARQKLSALDRVGRSQRTGPNPDIAKYKNILLDYYGLQGTALTGEEMTARYNLAPRTIYATVKKAFALLRLVQDDPSLSG